MPTRTCTATSSTCSTGWPRTRPTGTCGSTRPSGGKYVTTFWPQGTSADPEGRLLDSIKCNGATGGTGIGGHTLVYINMHAWFGTRGLGFANKVRGLYNRGCYVRVLYSFMSHAVFMKLHQGHDHPDGGSAGRCSPRNGKTAYLYSHYKNIAVSGNVAGNTALAWSCGPARTTSPTTARTSTR